MNIKTRATKYVNIFKDITEERRRAAATNPFESLKIYLLRFCFILIKEKMISKKGSFFIVLFSIFQKNQ